MAEETIWRGTSSQVKNISTFLFCAICVCALVVIFFFLWLNASWRGFSPHVFWLALVPNRVTDSLELYRVKDLETRQPFWERVFGVENVHINTADASSPFILIDAIPQKLTLADKVRNAVENVRMQKRVRELDVE